MKSLMPKSILGHVCCIQILIIRKCLHKDIFGQLEQLTDELC